jgi:hypothetical protein
LVVGTKLADGYKPTGTGFWQVQIFVPVPAPVAVPAAKPVSLPVPVQYTKNINSDFLEHILKKAQQVLYGSVVQTRFTSSIPKLSPRSRPKPPKLFSPSLDQLWLAARAKDKAIKQRLHLPTTPLL